MKETKLYVVSGPSGAGVADIVAEVFAARDDVSAVIPVTARKMKKNEINGIGFVFYDLEGWGILKENGDLLEQTQFAGNDYGTSRKAVMDKLSEGKNVLINLEPERAAQIKNNMPEAVFIYAEPSTSAVLKSIYEKNARNAIEVEVRMQIADEQRKLAVSADYRVCSDDCRTAVKDICRIIV